MVSPKICVVGLGYVGLPLFEGFLKKGIDCRGFDVSAELIRSIRDSGQYPNNLVSTDIIDFADCNTFIVTVPTPVSGDNNHPDLLALTNASETLGEILKESDTVIFESTVYPGVTEEICAPILEQKSGLKVIYSDDADEGFYVGYSPERISPGINGVGLNGAVKLVSGCSPRALKYISTIYSNVVSEIYECSSIRVAEASKLIENVQRDVNIALVNEFSLTFREMGIDPIQVIDAASTKWNFQKFLPGLVGGHCIGVDPYYFIYKQSHLNIDSAMQLAKYARAANEKFVDYMFSAILDWLPADRDSIVLFGAAFKPNIGDMRNSKAIDIAYRLRERGLRVVIYDPWIIDQLFENQSINNPDGFMEIPHGVLVVGHEEFVKLTNATFQTFLEKNEVLNITTSQINGAENLW